MLIIPGHLMLNIPNNTTSTICVGICIVATSTGVFILL